MKVFDANDRYHQEYIHISEEPVPVKSVTVNIEAVAAPK